MRTIAFTVLEAAALVAIAASGAAAGDPTAISTNGLTPFMYHGYAYVPLKGTADFLGASLWSDSAHNRTTVRLNGRTMTLVVGSITATYLGQPVILPEPPMLIDGQVLVPAIVFNWYLRVPLRWDKPHNRVLFRGPQGWGYFRLLTYIPPHTVPVLWTPYYPGPFFYSGTIYFLLRDTCALAGATLVWEQDSGRATVAFNGQSFVLVVGSPKVIQGSRSSRLPGPPIVMAGQVFCPREFFERHLNVKIEWEGGYLTAQGAKAGRRWRGVASAPARLVSTRPARQAPSGKKAPAQVSGLAR
jgi:hypothetical protein